MRIKLVFMFATGMLIAGQWPGAALAQSGSPGYFIPPTGSPPAHEKTSSSRLHTSRTTPVTARELPPEPDSVPPPDADQAQQAPMPPLPQPAVPTLPALAKGTPRRPR